MNFLKENSLILNFMAINVCTGTWVGLVNFIIPIYALSLNATSFEIGLIRGLSGVGDLLLVLPAGLMIDYFGSKKMYPISCVIGAIVTILLSFAGSPWALIVMMVVYGMARSVRTTALNASFFRYMSSIGVRKSGWYKGSMTVGSSFLGSLIGGAVAVILSFTGYFVFSAMFLIAPLLITTVLSDRNKPLLSDSSKRVEKSLSFKHYGSLLKNKIMLVSALTECVNSALFVTFTTFITVMVIQDLGLAVAVAAILISVRGLANMFIVFFCGRLLEINSNVLYCMSFVISSVGLLMLGTGKDVPVLVLASAIIGIASGVMSLITFAQVGSIEGDKGKIAGVFSFGQKIGFVSGPVLGGIVGGFLGIQAIFLCFIPFFIAMSLYNLIECRRTGIQEVSL